MSSWKFSRTVASRYLWTKRSEAFISIITIISILGVAIGVMVLNIVMAVMTGFEYELREKIVGADSHIVLRKLTATMPDWENVSQKISAYPEVRAVSPFTNNQALIRSQSSSAGLFIRGILPDTASAEQVAKSSKGGESTVHALFNPPKLTVFQGADLAEELESVELPGILIGRELARTLNLNVGEPLSVLSPQVTSSPFGLVPKYRRFIVAGIYDANLVEYESALAYVDLRTAQRFFGFGEGVSALEIYVKDINTASFVREKILDELGGLGKGFAASDWTLKNKPLWDALKLEKQVYFIVLLLIIVMASFSIITTLIMVVLEKRKDIAVLKTMGASTGSISRIFQLQGATIGFLGTVLGLVLGFLGCVILKKYGFPIDERIFHMSALPIRIELFNFVISGAAAFTICFLATIYPARRASALEPIEALRYE